MVAKRSVNGPFKKRVDAARIVFQADFCDAWSRRQSAPVDIQISNLREYEPYISEGFHQFLKVGRQFPRKIADPIKWAERSVASVIKMAIKGHPYSGDIWLQLLLLSKKVAAEETLRQPVVQSTVPGKAGGEECNANTQGHAASGGKKDRRAAIDTFISKLAESGRKITRKDIWTVAGYRDPTEFERFQRGHTRTTNSATANFERVLNMEPDDFIRSLVKKVPPK